MAADGVPAPDAEAFTVPGSRGQALACDLYHPPEGPTLPAAIILHGFMGNSRRCFYAQLAKALRMSTCTFDFPGAGGNSKGEYSVAGYADELNDVAAVADELRRRGHALEAVIGHSRGANLAIMYAAGHAPADPDPTPVCVAIAPRFHMKALPAKYFTPEQLAQAHDPAGPGYFDWTRGRRTLRVSRDDLEVLDAIDMGAVAASIPSFVPLMVCHGTADEVIPVTDAPFYANLVPNCTLRLFDGCNHSFSGEGAADGMIDAVVEWVHTYRRGAQTDGSAAAEEAAAAAAEAEAAGADAVARGPLVRRAVDAISFPPGGVLDHLYVTVSDLDSSQPWYQAVFCGLLGFREGKAPIDGDAHRHYYTPSFNLSVRGARHPPTAAQSGVRAALRPSAAVAARAGRGTAAASGAGAGGDSTGGSVRTDGGAAGETVLVSHDPYSPGLHHACFRVNTVDDVLAFAAGLDELGIAHTPPQVYPQYARDYFATHFRDPDGLRFEVMAALPQDPRGEAWGTVAATAAGLAGTPVTKGGGGGGDLLVETEASGPSLAALAAAGGLAVITVWAVRRLLSSRM